MSVTQSQSSAQARAELEQHLLKSGRLTPEAAARARGLASETGDSFELILTRLGLVSEDALADAFCDVLSLPLAHSSDYPSEPILEQRATPKFLKESRLMPLAETAAGVAIAFVNPLDEFAVNAAKFAARRPIIPYVARPSDFLAAFERLYGDGRSEIQEIADAAPLATTADTAGDLERLKDSASEAPIIRLVNLLITRAVEIRASDIHIEPMEDELIVRYRIDGVLHKVESPPAQMAAAIVSRIKIMAKLNFAERRLPQDGRIRLAVRGRDIDFRVSLTPTSHGESVALRILDRESIQLDLAALGFDGELARALRNLYGKPYGIVLVTGPTGSGKTTTLYAALKELNTIERKILTIEDPIEYQIRGVNQVQVRPQIGHTFASALRSFLRQDPDIMMVGEIRDIETAQTAIQAALTGHLILSTVHTNNAPSTITRLLDMGIEPFLLTSTINGIVAQRLVRKLCGHCREPYHPIASAAERLGLHRLSKGNSITLYHAKGCAHCNHTGYSGRTSIIEILTVTDSVRQLIIDRASATKIHDLAVHEGMRTLAEDGMIKALAGVTSVEEVIRAVNWD